MPDFASHQVIEGTSAVAVPGWLTKGRIPGLDGLRAIAVVLVLLAHAHQTFGFPNISLLHQLGSVGAIGVEVFFVISGFLITTLMFREITDTAKLDVKAFYWRRVIRILPAYLGLLFAVAAMQFLGWAVLSTSDWLAALTYTVNFLPKPAWEIGHAWSLSIEEHFYLIWPLIMALPMARLGPAACILCILGCPLLRWVVLFAFPDATQMAELWTFTRLDVIAFGCLLAILSQDGQLRLKLDRIARPQLNALVALIVLCGSLALSQFSAKFAVGVAYSANALCITVLVWHIVRAERFGLGKLLNWEPLVFIGTLSYSLYLWQQLFLNPHNDSFLCRFPQNLAFAVLAACGSYYLIEKPMLQWRVKQRENSAIRSSTVVAIGP